METRPQAADYAGLLTIALCWGSAFLVTKIAVDSFTPILVASGRVGIAAIILLSAARATRSPMPKSLKSWLIILLVAGSGTAVPFVLIAWGQTQVESSVASILMGLVPLMTLLLAHIFTSNEKLTGIKLAGVMTGFLGILVMFGGIELAGIGDGLIPKLAILAGAFGYAISGIGVRHLHGESALSVSALIMGLSFLLLAPIALIRTDWSMVEASRDSLLALLHLGLFPSALAAILLVRLIRSVGVTFFSFNNFLVPVIGVFLGAAVGGEAILPRQIAGLCLILAGIGVSQWPAYRRAMGRLHSRRISARASKLGRR